MEPPTRPLPRLPRPVAAAGIGAAVLGVPLAVTLWPDAAPAPAPKAVLADGEGRDAAGAASGIASVFRAEERTSRDRPVAPTPLTTTAAASPTAPPPIRKAPAPAPSVVKQLWVTADVTVRAGPSTREGRIGNLQAGARVGVTGVTRSGWTQVLVGGDLGWVAATYVSLTRPTPKPKARTEPAPAGVSNAACSVSPSIETHLTSNARAVYRAVCAVFKGSVSSFGGYRAGDSGDHGSGRAVDIMVSGDPGWAIVRYVQAHAEELHVSYVIYQQKIWMAGNPTGRWKLMEDRGSRTANHYDHVHVSVL